MEHDDHIETRILTHCESVIEDLMITFGVTLPQMDLKPFRLPDTPTIVWHADDGSASVVLNPDATTDIATSPTLSTAQLDNLSAALNVVRGRLGLACMARSVAIMAGETDQ